MTGATADRVYRVALFGNAMHQNNFARVFAPHPRVQIVVVVDEPGQEAYVAGRGRQLAAQYGVPYIEDPERAAAPDVDVISLGVEIERRGRLAARLAGFGKHLWLDKPPVATRTEAAALVEAVRSVQPTGDADATAMKTLVMSGASAAWCGAARHAVVSGRIGDLTALHLDVHFAKGQTPGLGTAGRRVLAGTGSRDRWTLRDPALGDATESSHHVAAKRELFELGWYPLAYAWFLTRRRVRRVYASAGAYFFAPHRDRAVEDFATLVLTLDGGFPVTVSTGRTGRQSHPGHGRMSLRAVGTDGSLAVDGGRPTVSLHGDTLAAQNGGVGTTVLGATDSFGVHAMVDHFVAVLDGHADSMLDAETGCHLTEALLAAYDSASTGKAIDL
jgi:predicted dehydrogenase